MLHVESRNGPSYAEICERRPVGWISATPPICNDGWRAVRYAWQLRKKVLMGERYLSLPSIAVGPVGRRWRVSRLSQQRAPPRLPIAAEAMGTIETTPHCGRGRFSCIYLCLLLLVRNPCLIASWRRASCHAIRAACHATGGGRCRPPRAVRLLSCRTACAQIVLSVFATSQVGWDCSHVPLGTVAQGSVPDRRDAHVRGEPPSRKRGRRAVHVRKRSS